MQKRASLNEKFNGFAAARFTKQANTSAAAKLKNAFNTPFGSMLAGTGVTGGLGYGAFHNLKRDLMELASNATSTTRASRAAARAAEAVEASHLAQQKAFRDLRESLTFSKELAKEYQTASPGLKIMLDPQYEKAVENAKNLHRSLNLDLYNLKFVD